MIEEHAVVVAVKDDVAMLEVIRKNPCGLCGKTRGCGISLWGKLFNHKSTFKAGNQIGAMVGDNVIVGIEEHAMLKNSMLIYGIPLAALLLGALFGMALLPADASAVSKDIYALVGAAAGLALGLLWLRGRAGGQRFDPGHQPVILRRDDVPATHFKCQRGE